VIHIIRCFENENIQAVSDHADDKTIRDKRLLFIMIKLLRKHLQVLMLMLASLMKIIHGPKFQILIKTIS